jgi:hypothetical protein
MKYGNRQKNSAGFSFKNGLHCRTKYSKSHAKILQFNP